MNNTFDIKFVSASCTSVQVGRQSYVLIEHENEFEIWFTHVPDDGVWCLKMPKYFEFRNAFNGCLLSFSMQSKFNVLRSCWLLVNRKRELAKFYKDKDINDILKLFES